MTGSATPSGGSGASGSQAGAGTGSRAISTGTSGGGGGERGDRGGGSGGGGGSTSTACAACKYQRRKCTPDCPLSPYFPPDQPKRFQNVHRLFGVSNILRILKHVDPSKREDTVKSIAYEADTREKDPVHGCLGVITILQNQVSKLKDELTVAREQLFLLQQQQHNFNQQAQMQQIVGSLGGSTSLVNVTSSAQETNVLMPNYQSYNIDMNNLGGSDFAKSNSLPIASFEPDQYLRNDGFDGHINRPQQQQGGASRSRFDIGRYFRGESPVLRHRQPPLLGHPAKEEQLYHRRPPSPPWTFFEQYSSSTDQLPHVDFSSSEPAAAKMVFPEAVVADDDEDEEGEAEGEGEEEGLFAMAIRRRAGPSGLLRVTVASEVDLQRSHGVPEHELRSAGVYLTLTNN